MSDSIRRVLWAATVRTKSLAERLEAATVGRFSHLTIFPSDFRRWEAEGLAPRDMRSMMRDADVRMLAIDPIGQWVPDFAFPSDYPELLRSHFEFDEADAYRMAEGLEAEEINLVEPFRARWARSYETAALAEAFNAFAERAAHEGYRTTLEFMPISGVRDFDTAWEIVRDCTVPGAGICFDTWHFARSGSRIEALEAVPGDWIAEVQISDARQAIEGDLINDLLHHRLLPGEGELPVAAIVSALRRIGGYRSVGPEIFSDVFDAMSATEAGRRAGASLDQWQ